MTKLRHLNRSTVLIACCSMFTLSAVALTLNVKTSGQQASGAARADKDELIKQVEESPDQSLRIIGNEDCPLKLVEAKVKEIPGPLFTRLTGRVTDLENVSSFPEATLVNTSGQTVTRFFLAIRNPKTRTTRALVQSQIAIKPGETYVLKREQFADPEKITTAAADGQVRRTLLVPGIDSEKRWIHFAARSDLFITIAKVDFEDGSSWVIKEGGAVR